MASYTEYGAGIVAGIGDKNATYYKNIITPYFDASFRNFVVGKDSIMSGFYVNGNKLTKGTCIISGYICEYPRDIEILESDTVIGFITSNESGEVYRFVVRKYASYSDFLEDQANFQGKWIYLYNGSQVSHDYLYPEKVCNAEYAEYARCADTLPSDTNDDRIATTSFVQSIVEETVASYTSAATVTKQIHEATTDIYPTLEIVLESPIPATVTFKRTGKKVILTFQNTVSKGGEEELLNFYSQNGANGQTFGFEVPSKYMPNKVVRGIVPLNMKSATETVMSALMVFIINPSRKKGYMQKREHAIHETSDGATFGTPSWAYGEPKDYAIGYDTDAEWEE